MKKFHFTRLFMASLLLLSLWVSLSVSKADDSMDPMKYLQALEQMEWNYAFWYAENDHLTIRNISSDSIDVDSPVIKNGGDDITSYWFFVAVDTWTWMPQMNRCFDEVSVDWNKFSVSLDTSWLNAGSVYYLYAVPISSSIKIGKNWVCSNSEALSWCEMSSVWRDSSINGDDPCLKISGNVFGKWNECSSSSIVTSSSTVASTTDAHTTAQSSSDISPIAWISHSFTWDQITLRWNSLSDEQMDVFYEDPDNLWTFVRLSTINTDDRMYTFTAKHDWDHLIRFAAVDGSRAKHYTAHYTKAETPEVTPTVKPPVVWPKENIMLVVFGTLILYVVYSVVRRRA